MFSRQNQAPEWYPTYSEQPLQQQKEEGEGFITPNNTYIGHDGVTGKSVYSHVKPDDSDMLSDPAFEADLLMNVTRDPSERSTS